MSDIQWKRLLSSPRPALIMFVVVTGLMITGCMPPPGMAPFTPGAAPNMSPRRVDVTSTPEAMNVTVDGQSQGQTPWQGDLSLGRHTVYVGGNNGYRAVGRRVAVGWRESYYREHVYVPRIGALDYRFFNYQIVLQPQGLTLGEFTNTEGGGFLGMMRFVFTIAKPFLRNGEMLIDLGLELGSGGFNWRGTSDEFVGYDGERYRLRQDEWGYRDEVEGDFWASDIFQVGLYFGLNIPLYVQNKPVLYLALNTTQGTNANGSYQFHISAGLALMATDLMELRFELAAFRAQLYTDIFEQCVRDPASGDCEWERNDSPVLLAHYTPSFVLSFRFH